MSNHIFAQHGGKMPETAEEITDNMGTWQA